MKRARVLSTESKVYHRPACRYVKRIQYANRMELMPKEAKQYGYRPCKCCNTMAYLYDTEWSSLDYFERKWDLQFCFKDGVVYVKTAISCWKLVYSRREERIALYHRNASKVPVDFEHPENERYHRQNDCANAKSISAMCKYIYEHDRFRDAQSKGQKLTTFTSERSKLLAQRSYRRDQRRRVDHLFRMLEASNKGYKELSYC